MDENRCPSTHAITVQAPITQTSSTAAAAQSTTTIKQEDGGSIRIKPEHDSFSLLDLPAFGRKDDGMEVIFEDDEMEVIFEDDDLEEEDADVQEEENVVIKFGPHHGPSHATKFGLNRPRTITKRKPDCQEDEPRTRPDSDSDSDSDSAFESMSLGTHKRRKTKTDWANTTAISTTATKLRPETTMVLSTKQVITRIFSSNSPRAHSNTHTYPLPPDQPHRHSYHSPLLLSFPSSSNARFTESSTAAARKHRDALLTWFDKYCAAHQMPWRKAWVDASPLRCPASSIPSTSATITPASAPPSMPTTSNSKPTSDSLVGPKVKASPPIPDSVLLFPNLAASILRAQAEAEAQKQQKRAEAEARARARAHQVTAKSQKQAQTLQTLRSTISQRFYETLLSEILRQIFRETDQEQAIKNITTQYDRWIKAVPTMEDLAKAREEEVAELSDDIRATRLHKAARQICEGKRGNIAKNTTAGLPNTVEELQKLPGVEPHTAGVLAAVVFGRAEPMVNWDVTRVLARQLGIKADANKKETREVIWEAARKLVEQVAWDGVEAKEEAKAKKRLGLSKKGTRKPINEGENVGHVEDRRNRGPPPPLSDRPGRWGQALMELGAAVCLAAPKTPLCHLCPIQATCRAYTEGLEIAREEGLVVGNKTTKKEQNRQALKKKVDKLQRQKVVVDIEDAACTLCPPLSLPPSLFSSDTSTRKIKKENQDHEIWQQPGEEDTDTDVHYLGTVPKTAAALPSTKDTQTAQDTTQQTNKQQGRKHHVEHFLRTNQLVKALC